MAKFLNNTGLSRLISKIKAALNNKIDKVTSTDNAVVRFDGTSGNVQNSGVTINDSNQITAAKFITSGGTSSQLVKGDGSLETSDNYVKYVDTSYVNVETVGFKSKTRTFGGSGWYRIYQGYYTPVHIMLTRGYNSPAPEGYDLDIETYDVTLTDDLWGIATITQNAGYYSSASNQEIEKIRVYGYNGAPSANPNNTDKSKLCIDVYINDRSERYNNVYDVSGYCLQRGTTVSGRFFNYAELTADNIEYAAFCQNFGNSRYYLEFTLVNGFKTNKSAYAQSFIKDGGTSSQFLLGDGSVTTLKTVNSISLLGSGNVAVQPTLVSGTNIKTINNTSLLGSGNINVQTPLTFDSTPTANSTNPVTSGGIKTALDAKKGISDISTPDPYDGTITVELDNGDDITLDLNHTHPQYQENLVSGTNIKTINNNSLLGSGNINVVSDVKQDNVSLVTNNVANIPHDILQLDGWDFDSDIGGSSITDAQYNTIVQAAADHKLIKIGDTLVTVREDTDTDYYIICGITPNDGAGELAVKALKVTKQSYSGEHYLANGGLISGSTIEQQILTDLANYLPLSGGTMSGAIKFPRTSSAMDYTSGINFINGNTTTAHIGDDTNNSLGIYSNGKIILRPNGASSSATSNGSITIDNSGVIVNENITAEKFITSGGTSSQFVKGDGTLDNSQYAKLGDWQMPTNSFGGSATSIQQNIINNGLYAANSRFNVTLTNISADYVKYRLFDGSFDTYCTIAAGETGIILIEGKDGNSLFGSYNYGWTYISFYYTYIPESVSMRVYAKGGGTTDYGWHTLTMQHYIGNNNSTSNYCVRFPNTSFYTATKFEITITAKSSTSTYITQVEHQFSRGTVDKMSAVTKYAVNQDLYGTVIAPAFQKRGGTATQFLKADGSVDSTSYAPLNSPAITGTPTAPTASAGTNTTQIATTAFVQTAINNLPEPMVFKGTIGTGGTSTTVPSSATEGDTYKIIEGGQSLTFSGISNTIKVGDTVIYKNSTTGWVLIPSGDEPSGTVTSVGMTVPTGLSVSGSPITSSGTLAVSFASGYSIPTTVKQTEWDNKANTASPVFTGTPTAPTASIGTNTTQIATTEFVQTTVNNKVHYVANLQSGTAANYITEPEFKSVKINGSTTNSASNSNCVLQYDTTNACLKFTFN